MQEAIFKISTVKELYILYVLRKWLLESVSRIYKFIDKKNCF